MDLTKCLAQIGELVVNEAKKNLTVQGINSDDDVLLRNSLTYRVEGNSVIIGTNIFNAVWREYGTGRFAVHGDGRTPWWIYVTSPNATPVAYIPSTQPVRSLKQAYAIKCSMNEKFESMGSSQRAYISEGNPARPFLQPALDNNKNTILEMINETITGGKDDG